MQYLTGITKRRSMLPRALHARHVPVLVHVTLAFTISELGDTLLTGGVRCWICLTCTLGRLECELVGVALLRMGVSGI